MLFLESVALMKKAEVCSIRLQGFKSRFEPALEKWRTANTVSLKNGEQFLRTAASVENKDFNMHVNAVTDIAAQLLNQASQAILEENCRAMLQLVGSDG